MATANTRRNPDARDDDYYTTPAWAVDAILDKEPLHGAILDAGCGDGCIGKVVEQRYPGSVVGIDLIDRGYGNAPVDFLYFNSSRYNTVISNPPYKLFTEFVQRALYLGPRKVLIFARVNALESAARYQAIYQDNPPQRIYLFSKRVQCLKGGAAAGAGTGSAVFYCWLVWDRKDKGRPTETYWLA